MAIPTPGNPHPDVFVLVQRLIALEPGENLTKEEAAKLIGCKSDELLVRRMTAARKVALRQHGVNIVAVPNVGWHRELPGESAARMTGKEIPGLHRKSRKLGRQMQAVDVAALSEAEKVGYFCARTIVNISGVATAPATRKRIAAETQKSLNVTPMADALKLLNGEG